jgi:hypothetical protein
MRTDRTLLALLLAAPLVVLGTWVKPVPPNPLDRDSTDEARFYMVKTHGGQQCDVIVIGDSRALRDVSPQELARSLPGQRIFNFAYNSGGLNAEMYAAAAERLDPAANAPMVTIAVTPLSLMTAKARNEQYHEVLHKSRDERWLMLHAPGLLRWFQPVRPAEVVRPLLGVAPHSLYHQEFHDDGWIGSLRQPENPGEAFGIYEVELSGKTTDPVLVRELLDQTRAWTRAGVRVVGFRPPTTDEVEGLENRLLGFDEKALAVEFAAAGGIWLDFANTPYQTYDGSHLRRESAVAFSRDLGAALRAALPPP